MPAPRTPRRVTALLTAAAIVLIASLLVACGSSQTTAPADPTTAAGAPTTPDPPATAATTTAPATAATTTAPATTSTTTTNRASPAKPAAATSQPLAGKTVGIDPGHNGRNYSDPAFINHLIWNGRERETCNTTGTATDGGYTEARFNFNVATYLAADLKAEGAKVVLTRHNNDGVGPCVNVRAHIIDAAHANVAIDIHADGGPPGGRGFALLEPVADGINNRIIGASERYGRILIARMLAVTGMPTSTYDGIGGVMFRDNLAGLNLTTVPEVLIESGNMRNATDAALLVSASFQRREATAIAQAITQFLTGRP
jgi:N-acetylmuramoyl-L-alanine amidase